MSRSTSLSLASLLKTVKMFRCLSGGSAYLLSNTACAVTDAAWPFRETVREVSDRVWVENDAACVPRCVVTDPACVVTGTVCRTTDLVCVGSGAANVIAEAACVVTDPACVVTDPACVVTDPACVRSNIASGPFATALRHSSCESG